MCAGSSTTAKRSRRHGSRRPSIRRGRRPRLPTTGEWRRSVPTLEWRLSLGCIPARVECLVPRDIDPSGPGDGSGDRANGGRRPGRDPSPHRQGLGSVRVPSSVRIQHRPGCSTSTKARRCRPEMCGSSGSKTRAACGRVRSLDETQVLRDAKNAVWRVRDVLKYTEFEPNAKVDPRLFTEAALRLPSRSRIIDDRPEAREPTRLVP